MSLFDRKSLELQSQLMLAARNLVTACYLKMRNGQATTLELDKLPATDQIVLNHFRLKTTWTSLLSNRLSTATLYPLLNKAGIDEINDDLSVIVFSCPVGADGKCKLVAGDSAITPRVVMTPTSQPTENSNPVESVEGRNFNPVKAGTADTLDFKVEQADLVADQTRSLSKHLNCQAYYTIVMNALIDAAAGDLKTRLQTLRDRK